MMDFWEALFEGALPPLNSLRPLAPAPVSVGNSAYVAPRPAARVGNALYLPQGGRGEDEVSYGGAPVDYSAMSRNELIDDMMRNAQLADSAGGMFDLTGLATGKDVVRSATGPRISAEILKTGGNALFPFLGTGVSRLLEAGANQAVQNALAEITKRGPDYRYHPYGGLEFEVAGPAPATVAPSPFDMGAFDYGADPLDDPVGNWGGGPADIY